MAENTKVELVRCPEPLRPLFAEAQSIMSGFFGDLERTPQEGQIKIKDVRYMLVRTDSMSLELQDELRKTFGESGARQIRYRLGKACGTSDAKLFHERLAVNDPHMRLALGPVHFAHVGWAFVDIFPESDPQTNEDYFLMYDHPYSFEADAYVRNGVKATAPVCLMNAGYSTGWCQQSYGVELKAEEVTCRAMGHDKCIFVMAHPKNFDRRLAECKEKLGLV